MGITVEIDGIGRVQLDDSFSSLSPERQKEVISGIVATMKGAPANDPQAAMRDRIAAAKAGTLQMDPRTPDPAAANQIAEDQMTLSAVPAWLQATTKFAQGVPFVGEYSDELTGMVNQKAGDMQRAVQGAMDRQYPKTSLGLQIAGGIAGSAGLGGMVAKGAQALGVTGNALAGLIPATTVGRVAAGTAAGATVGGIEGAVSGYGAGTEGNRGASAFSRGLAGMVTGAAFGGAAPAVSAGLKNALEWMKGRDVNVIASSFKISKDAAKVVKAAIEADDFAAAQAAIKRAGSDAMLADASPATRQLLDTAMQSGGTAARIGREAVETRATAANDRLTRTLDSILGSPTGTKAASTDISTRTAGIRAQAYDRAYNTAIDYAGGAGRGIEAVLQRIPPRTVQAAVNEANDAMRAAGVTNRQIMVEIADDGAVTFREMPNVQQLDELKKALQSIGRNETDPVTGRITGAGMRANSLARDLSDAIGSAVPSYKTAVKLGGDKIAEQNALDLGRKLLLPSTTRETVAETMAGASKEAQDAARRGLRTYLDDTLANVKSAVTNPNRDAAEALQLVRDLSSRANMEKVEIVLGKSRASALFKALDEARAQLETRASVARNSATASRLAGKEAIDEITQPGVIGTLAQGRPGEAARQVVQALTGQTPQAMNAQKQAIYAEIAQALTAMRGPEAEAALAVVNRAIAGQPVASADAARVARLVAGSTALVGYQSANQSLAMSQGGR